MRDIKDLLQEFGDRVITGLQQNIDREGLSQSDLRASLEAKQGTNEISILANSYWPYAEKGRGPGGTPYNFIEILIAWMHKYGVTPDNGDERSFAWAIKKKTENEGSRMYREPQYERDFELDKVVNENMDWLENELILYTVDEVTKITDKKTP